MNNKEHLKEVQNFKRKLTSLMLLASAIVFFSQTTFAQNRWSFEFRPNANFAIQKLGEANLNVGYGTEGTFAYRFMSHLSVYAGWSWNHFGSDQNIDGVDLDFEETGYTYGLQFIHPIGASKISFLARAGGLANHIEVEKGDDIIADSGHGFGWQAEGGLAIPLGEYWQLMPSIRYRSLSRDIELEDNTTTLDLNYVSAGLGIAWTF